ncbi:reverse transcriptase domain-containing protein [Tanacetum coccineum]
MEAQYVKFLNMIRTVRINVPLVDVFAGMLNYRNFLKELVSNKHKLEQISSAFLSDESSAMIQNKVPPKLGDLRSFLIPCNFNKAFSCDALADLAKNMQVEVGKFTFLVDFVILEMEEDNKIPLILGRPFLHTTDAVIRVKQKPLATFQRCMLAIFHDMIEESVEVFMDDFSIFGKSFDKCLKNLNKMLQCCKDENLVFNLEKCQFMVKEGIMLGHKVSGAGIEVDKAKINVISKLPPPTNVKGIRKFDIEIKDKKGIENVVADHLSWIENDETSDDIDVDDNFPRETLMEITTNNTPWFADFANYLVGDIIPKGITYQQKNKFFSNLKNYFWEDPYLFKVCLHGMIRRCVSGPETRTILDQCHHGPSGGHYGPNTTAKKVLDLGFY